MYLKITNNGEVPVEAFTLVGASTKRNDDSKIGMFGSGNKYALAYLIRAGYDIKIFSGKKELEIKTKPITFGSEKINVIVIDGKETSITTDMGPKWTLWQALRELYSNALDEGKLSFELIDSSSVGFESKEGQTSIFVKSDYHIEKIVNNFALYFSEETPFLFKTAGDKILQKTGKELNAFRRGIRCFDSDQESLYDYDIFNISLNESRIVDSTSDLYSSIWRILITCDNEVVVKDLLDKFNDNHEIMEFNEYLDYWSRDTKPLSEAWRNVMKDRFVAPRDLGGFVENYLVDKTWFVPNKLYGKIIREFGREHDALKSEGSGHIKDTKLEPTALEKDSIKKVSEFFDQCGYDIDFPILVVNFFVAKDSEGSIMGLADNGNILVSRKAFDKGLFYVASVVYEENFHLKTGHGDRTLAMQNGLIEEMLTYMKKSNSINL